MFCTLILVVLLVVFAAGLLICGCVLLLLVYNACLLFVLVGLLRWFPVC